MRCGSVLDEGAGAALAKKRSVVDAVDLGGTADAYVTPFARLQGYTGIQNSFTETRREWLPRSR